MLAFRTVLRPFVPLALFLLTMSPCAIAQETPTTSVDASTAPAATEWLDDYGRAMTEAKNAGKMLLLWFVDERNPAANDAFERDVLRSQPIAERLRNFITVKLPVGATFVHEGKSITLLQHSSLAEMLGRPGVAIIDQRDPESPHFGRVVSVYPFTKGPITRDRLAVLLDLPTGTLTQRTMIFAVRTHPLRPQSAWSEMSDMLAAETQQHSTYQASIRLQGHHRWEQRFHQINARLPAHLVANEVCAESWPGQTLVEAAEECVDCWRQSSGHWDHVSRRHAMFGYDIKRGSNGIWYATGIFASYR